MTNNAHEWLTAHGFERIEGAWSNGIEWRRESEAAVPWLIEEGFVPTEVWVREAAWLELAAGRWVYHPQDLCRFNTQSPADALLLHLYDILDRAATLSRILGGGR